MKAAEVVAVLAEKGRVGFGGCFGGDRLVVVGCWWWQ